MVILHRYFRRNDIVGHRVYCQIPLAPDSPFLGAVFSDFPLALAKHLQTCRADNLIGVELVAIPSPLMEPAAH